MSILCQSRILLDFQSQYFGLIFRIYMMVSPMKSAASTNCTSEKNYPLQIDNTSNNKASEPDWRNSIKDQAARVKETA